MREESDNIRDEIFEEIENLPPAETFGPVHARRLMALLQAYLVIRGKEIDVENTEIADWESEGGAPSTA